MSIVNNKTMHDSITKILNTFLSSNYKKYLTVENNEENILQMFHSFANQIPAYNDFLNSCKIDVNKIISFNDYLKLPLLTKENYCSKYDIASRCLNGKITECDFFSVSSGTTGQPFLWGRSIIDEIRATVHFENILRYSFNAHEKQTLIVICFPLGVWVGGLHTINCLRLLSLKDYLISIITPGNNVTEIIRSIKQCCNEFEQLILIGYPPFIRATIDEGIKQNINWEKLNMNFIFAGESFSEEWRDTILEKVSSKSNLLSSASFYGTADAGVIANETPLSISLRRYFIKNKLLKNVFGINRSPALFQYFPNKVYFEVIDNEIVLSIYGSFPLIRYNIHDKGGILTNNEMMTIAFKNGYIIPEEIKSNFIKGIYEMPFVYIFGRSDQTVSLFGANIYAETISECLNSELFRSLLTGKFVMSVEELENGLKQLCIVVELLSDKVVNKEIEKNIEESVLKYLQNNNSEYKNYVPFTSQKVHIILKSFQDNEFFNNRGKHKYSR